MDTAYKTRAWWALRAIDYARAIEEHVPRHTALCVPLGSQGAIWALEMRASMDAATGPVGSEALMRQYVDRKGDLLQTAQNRQTSCNFG